MFSRKYKSLPCKSVEINWILQKRFFGSNSQYSSILDFECSSYMYLDFCPLLCTPPSTWADVRAKQLDGFFLSKLILFLLHTSFSFGTTHRIFSCLQRPSPFLNHQQVTEKGKILTTQRWIISIFQKYY